MKKIFFILLFACMTNIIHAENRTASEDLQAFISEFVADPLLKTAREDYAKFGSSIDLHYGDSDLEQKILSNIMMFVKSFISGNMTSDYASYSSQMQQVEKDYNDNLSQLHPHSILRWFCPFALAFYHDLNSTDIDLALNYMKKADEFILSFPSGAFCIYHASNISSMAQFYNEKERYDEALNLVLQEIEKLEGLDLTATFTYSQLEYTLAQIYYRQDNYEKARIYYNDVLSRYDDFGIGETFIAASVNNALAICHAQSEGENGFIEALNCLTKSFGILENIGVYDPDLYLECYCSYLHVSMRLNDSDTILEIAPTILELASNILETKIPLMSENERHNFWINEIGPIYSEILPIITWLWETGPMSYYMYYALLQSRGLQLNCNNYFSNLIAQSEDQSLVSGLSKLSSLKSEYNRAKTDYPIKKNLLADLKQEITHLEHNLLRSLKEKNSDILSWMEVSIEDIKGKMSDTELAVEFFSVPLDDGPLYCALAINNNETEPPTYIEMLSEENFNIIKDRPNEVSDSIWSKILDIYPNTTRIYFASCGDLNNFPIELCINRTNISSDFTAVRLSSTREIALDHKSDSEQIVLLGDFNYNQSLRSIADQTRLLTNRTVSLAGLSESIDPDAEISGIFDPLPGAGKEIDNLTSILGNSITDNISGDKGVESAFKYLSGKPYKILHIATHGYYNNHGNNPNTAMDNCGLAFSGVNTLESLDILPPFLEDGKLTAAEISNLDLWGTDLVCLSACSSGMASISSDGAYGLQRGFKLAGVNSIIMSLWDIADEGPTNLMMNSFYRHYSKTYDKLNSYHNAVEEVRETYPEFKDWASFIIIDAL